MDDGAGLPCNKKNKVCDICVFYVCIMFTSKEKHSLTRKLVGYRNWRQRWCKKEGNKVLGKDK